MKSIISKSLDITFKGLITLSHLIHSNPGCGVKTNFHISKFSEVKNQNNVEDYKILVNKEKSKIDKEEEPIKIIEQIKEQNDSELIFKETSLDNISKSDKILLKNDTFKAIESKVPSSSFSRAMGFGMLGISMVTSALPGTIYSKFSGDEKGFKDYLVSESNAEKLSRTLCKMRGAALKFGQLLSSFENVVIPEPIRIALEKARHEANAMPKKQFLSVMNSDLGVDWEGKFTSFDKDPFAAASIGQVHLAEIDLKELNFEKEDFFTETKDTGKLKLAVKVQFPGVSKSIESDLNNLKNLFKYLKLVPKGLYIDKVVDNLGEEIKEECNYILEAERQRHYYRLIQSEDYLKELFFVPRIINQLSGKNVLTSEFIDGLNIDDIESYSQEVKDFVGEKLLELCLTEIFLFRFMQTDPNPANFFVFAKNKNAEINKNNIKIGLIDFGAARSYSENFVDTYLRIVYNGSKRNRENVIKYSNELGFLTGFESEQMLDAHTNSVISIAEPFSEFNKPEIFDFGNQNVTEKIYKELPVMLKHRLTSPPTEIYSLHRRLSGVYLSCIRLKARVRSKMLFTKVVNEYCKLHNKTI